MRKFQIPPARRSIGAGGNSKFQIHGFTLIETMTAMGVFVVLIGVGAAIFLVGLRSQRNQIDLLLATDNASLTLEQMVREIRTGGNFCIPTGSICPPGITSGTDLRFQNANQENVFYRFNQADETIERSSDGGTTFVPLTSSNVVVTNLSFSRVDQLQAFDDTSPWPPRILIVLEIGSKKAGLQSVKTKLQATVSARNI